MKIEWQSKETEADTAILEIDGVEYGLLLSILNAVDIPSLKDFPLTTKIREAMYDGLDKQSAEKQRYRNED